MKLTESPCYECTADACDDCQWSELDWQYPLMGDTEECIRHDCFYNICGACSVIACLSRKGKVKSAYANM